MGRWGGYGRRTVEQTRSVDIDALRRAGYIGKPRSTWWVHRQRLSREGIRPTHWSNNGTITLDDQTLCIRQVPWHYGGKRAVFWCACGRMARKLYAPRGQPWRCRHCYRLTYATRQASRPSRLLLKAQKIRERLGGSPSVCDDFPAKPKGMHWRRYERLWQAHEDAADTGVTLIAAHFLSRWGARHR
jgi:hypothetical protein